MDDLDTSGLNIDDDPFTDIDFQILVYENTYETN